MEERSYEELEKEEVFLRAELDRLIIKVRTEYESKVKDVIAELNKNIYLLISNQIEIEKHCNI